MLGFISGKYDILRGEDLAKLDRAIQENMLKGNKYFALAIYDDDLCYQLGLDKPIKSLEDRLKIAERLSGVDFVFSISSMDKENVENTAGLALEGYIKELQQKKDNDFEKKYDIVYAPGTYDLLHAGHLENLLEAARQSKKLIVGVKSDELVQEHKGKTPIISAEERMDILRHFDFVDDVYRYYTRDPHIAAAWIESKYGKKIDAIFLGSDLKEDFGHVKDIKIVFTDRTPEKMKGRSTTVLRKKISGYAGFSTIKGPNAKLQGIIKNINEHTNKELDSLEDFER